MMHAVYGWGGMLALVLASMPSPAWAQGDAAGFDITRARLVEGSQFETFHVRETQLLRDALRANRLQPTTSLLVPDRTGGLVAVITDQMASHHIAQGELAGEPWLIAFCLACNTGMGMTPRVDGRALHFVMAGTYDGLVLMRDEETSTIWNHITGAAVHGPLKGKQLPTYNVLHMSAARALETYPNLRVAISDQPFRRESFLQKLGRRVGLSNKRFFRETVTHEDTRRPTMDLGLGVWSRATHRYYPLEYLTAAGNVIVDQLDGRTLVVCRSVKEGAPDAFYAATASAQWDGDELRLEGGQVYRNGVLYDKAGTRLEVERPMQLFTRWYGFALTFPKTEIYQPQQHIRRRNGERASPRPASDRRSSRRHSYHATTSASQ
jgi:hypothetical protein